MSGFGADQIESLIQAGNGFATAVLGKPYQFYRPGSASAPMASSYGTIAVWMTEDEKFSSPRSSQFGKASCYGLFDRTTTRPGDYLTGPAGTFFIAGEDSLNSTLLIECNAVLSFFSRASAPSKGDDQVYLGRTTATDVPIMGGWPASVLIKTRGDTSQNDLPSEPKQALFEVLLPAYPGITLASANLVTDDQGRRFTLSATERSALGWRLYAQLNVG